MSFNFLSLPADVIANVCQCNLSLEDLVHLDTAVCNKAQRNLLLASQAKICVTGTARVRPELLHKCFTWLANHGMLLSSLSIAWIDETCFSLLKHPHILSNLRSLQVHYIEVWPEPWWPSFIALCANLEEFVVRADAPVFEALETVAQCCPKLRVVSLTASDPQIDTAFLLTKIVRNCSHLQELVLNNCQPSDYQPLLNNNVSLLATTYYPRNYQSMHETGAFDYPIILYRSPEYYGPSAFFILARNAPYCKVAEVISAELETYPELIIHMISSVYKRHFAPLHVYLHGLVWIEIANCEDWTTDDFVGVLQLQNVRAINLEGNHTITTLPDPLRVSPNLRGLSLKRFTTITTSALLELVNTNASLTVEACRMRQISRRAHMRIIVL